MHGLGEQHVADRVVGAGHLAEHGLEPGLALPADTVQCASSRNHASVGSIVEQPQPVDDVAGGHRLDGLVEVTAAGPQRRGDAQGRRSVRPRPASVSLRSIR